MKTTRILLALMLLSQLSVFAEKEKYSVKPRANMVNGTVVTPDQSASPDDSVMVRCEPHPGYGLSKGVFYATVDADGKRSAPIEAKAYSHYPDDRANDKQPYKFAMPAADVEVWAEFEKLRTLIIHQTAGGALKPLYGVDKNTLDSNVVRNVAKKPVVLKVKPNDGYELVDVEFENLKPSYCVKTADELTITMPTHTKTIHVTPVFARKNYAVTVKTDPRRIKVTMDNTAPKSRDEVQVTILAEKGYIPANVSITGCSSWWQVGKPQLQEDGRWQVVYRFKVDKNDVTINVGNEQVYAFSVNDQTACHRVKTYIPEMIPGFPGVARKGQQVPVVFQMPEEFSVKCTYEGAPKTPLVYHNLLENSFADEGMISWRESNDYVGNGLSMKVFTDTVGNRYWHASVKNSMSQTVSLPNSDSYPSGAVSKDGKLTVATIVSINSLHSNVAKVSLEPSGDFINEPAVVVADMHSRNNGWETELNMTQINSKASKVKFVVQSEGYDRKKSLAYEGPMFDDLCLLIPTSADTIRNEDVLIFTMDGQDVTISYTPTAKLNTVKIQQDEHASLTLLNTVTGEEGSSIQATKNDRIVIKGKSDENYAIFSLKGVYESPEAKVGQGGSDASSSSVDKSVKKREYPIRFRTDSVKADTREFFAHFVMNYKQEATITPVVDQLKIDVINNYGGEVEVSETNPQLGDKVELTVTPLPGGKLKQIRTIPAGVLTLKADSVDANTGGGKYSFEMPTAYISLIAEFIAPVKTADDLESINGQEGEFFLDNDLDLGDNYSSEIDIMGHFNGNGHRITYGGETCLFKNVFSSASIRHLYVKANVDGSDDYLGGIAATNFGVIEDCEVSGRVKNSQKDGFAGGVAGQNGSLKGTISHCHVICDAIDAPTNCGIAYQEEGAVIRDNVFNGQLTVRAGRAYMICNDVEKSTVEGNNYIQNDANLRAEICSGASVSTADKLFDLSKETTDTYPVFANSLKAKYGNGFSIDFSFPSGVSLVNISQRTASAGIVVYASVTVAGNSHLDSISVAAPDGSDVQNCTFTDNEDNVYHFSFTMPAHDVRLIFKTKAGRYIYTPKQFAAINKVQGTYYLARDLELNNWEKEVVLSGTFYGEGHTIKYNALNACKGLFLSINRGALLQGLRVVGMVETSTDCGGITYKNQGTIRDCHFSGRIQKISGKKMSRLPNYVSAIACIVEKTQSQIDHCSASAELIVPDSISQHVIDKNPLCYQGNVNITNSYWVSPTETSEYQQLLGVAQAADKEYPVFAWGIVDHINPCIIVGSDTIRVENGTTLDQLTIIDGKPFVSTGDVKVNRIVYKRNAATKLEPWILPFEFDRIAGTGSFEYHRAKEVDKKPDMDEGTTITLSQSPTTLTYAANEPMMVKGEGTEYVLTNSSGPITLKATYHKDIARYASLFDKGLFYAAYDSIPAKVAQEGLMYVWNTDKQEFVFSDSVTIDPFRFYVQFYSQEKGGFVKYTNTQWGRNEAASSGNRAQAVRQRMAAAMADGWQTVFLDPRQPQSVTARMLDDYEVACLTDVNGEIVDDDADSPLAAVSLVYQMVDGYMELPTAVPLLVRAKRSDAAPLVSEQMGDEIATEILLSLMYDEEDADTEQSDFYMPHYWCASFGNRLDIWPLPSRELYADWVDTGCMLFDDNYLEQSFNYPKATDTRTTSPMSYCISVLNTDTYEPLPLIGDRVYVEFLPSASETTGISLTPSPSLKGEGSGHSYNLSGQRVGASYKGIIIQNGRKVIRK